MDLPESGINRQVFVKGRGVEIFGKIHPSLLILQNNPHIADTLCSSWWGAEHSLWLFLLLKVRRCTAPLRADSKRFIAPLPIFVWCINKMTQAWSVSAVASCVFVKLFWGRILGRKWDKSLQRVFLLAIHNHIYGFYSPPWVTKSGFETGL